MKKVLFGTTALLGGLLLTQGAMAAETTVKIGGDIRFDAGFIDDDLENASDINFLQEFRMPITMDGVADNGLQYGAMVRIRNTGQSAENIVADRRYIYVGGDWGRVDMGDEWGPTTKLEVLSPTIGIGQVDGAYDFTDFGNMAYSHVNEYNRSTKIAYYTPRFSGFQAGIGYTPERGQSGDSVTNRPDDAGVYSDQVELAANYEGTFGDVGVAVGAGYSFADIKAGAVADGFNDDLKSYFAGAQVSYGGFVVGGGYFDNNEVTSFSGGAYSAVDDQKGWNVGATYTTGPMAFAVSYGRVETDDTDDDMFVVGANYVVAPGLSVAADVYFFDIENAGAGYTDGENEGTVAVLRTRLTF